MKQLLPILLLIGCASTQAQAPTRREPPKLIVGIVVDQMRADMISRYWNGFGDGGFKRLVNGGTHVLDCHLSYTPSFTGPGHASIYTGTTPAVHGIVSNWPYVREHNAHIYCVDDNTRNSVGKEGAPGRSPKNLLSSTLADELELFSNGRSRTIGIALKDRSSILPAGRMGDAAYWFYHGGGDWITTSWYREELPQWVSEFNAADHAEKYMQQKWDLYLDRKFYTRSQEDNSRYELPVIGSEPTLPIDLAKATADGLSVEKLVYTPFGNSLTVDMAIAAIQGEQLGADVDTDLLAISFSSTDEIGHEVGIRSLEIEDTYYRLDRDLERLLDHLDEKVGAGEYLVFLTADHGAVDVPAFLSAEGGSAGIVDRDSLRAAIDARLSAKFGPGPWVLAMSVSDVFLDHDAMDRSGVDRGVIERMAASILLGQPGIAEVVTRTQLIEQHFSEGVRGAMQKGFMPQRSGDLRYSMLPSHLPKLKGMEEAGTEHGTHYNYDSHIPLIFYGNGIPAGVVARRVWVEDIAPSVSHWTGIALPDAATGRAIHELFR